MTYLIRLVMGDRYTPVPWPPPSFVNAHWVPLTLLVEQVQHLWQYSGWWH
jgi:hypothetical protein